MTNVSPTVRYAGSSTKVVCTNMVRVLCLHGWGANRAVFDYQLQKLREKFAETEFVVLEADYEIEKQTDPVLLERFKGKYYAWFDPKVSATTGEVEYQGLARGVELIVSHLKSTLPYDGVLGFSQGATIAALILALQNYSYAPSFFKFAIFICPGLIPFINMMEYIPRCIPVVFFLGEQDVFTSVGLLLARCFVRPVVVVNESGHRFPKLTEEVVEVLRRVMASPESKL